MGRRQAGNYSENYPRGDFGEPTRLGKRTYHPALDNEDNDDDVLFAAAS